jgi:hypothetical protein
MAKAEAQFVPLLREVADRTTADLQTAALAQPAGTA